jgi:hypothetical protein
MILHPRAAAKVPEYHHARPPSPFDLLLLFSFLAFKIAHYNYIKIRKRKLFSA